MPSDTHVVDSNPDTESFDTIPAGACINWDECENVSPGGNHICPDCLDAARKRDREAEYRDYLTYLQEVMPDG